MKTSHFAPTRQVQRQLLLLLATASVYLAGCSTTSSTASSSSPIAQAVTLSGRVHGGNQPVAGATVQLWAAGQGPGLPSNARLLATTTSSNDGAGNFNFTRNPVNGLTPVPSTNVFSCPAPAAANLSPNGGPYIFVVARGGNTVNNGSTTVNNDAVFIAPFGRCGGITTNTFVSMSEVVTAATVAAIHQYMNPSVTPMESSIGSDGIYVSDLALSRSFDLVSNMVDLSTGLSRASLQRSTTNASVSSVTVTVTPEQAKLNHIGNILSSCINNAASGSAACTTLYGFTAPPASFSTTSVPAASAGAATDVLTAAYYLFTNPTNGSSANLTGLYNVPSATAPYQPMLTTQPTDWTIGIDYTASGTCTDVTGSTANFINRSVDFAVDTVGGNVWFANNQSGAGSLGEIDPTGVPIACFTLPAGTNNQGSTFNSGAQSTVVDVQDNIWIGSARSSNVYRLTPGSGNFTTISASTTGLILALTADGYGDVFYTTINGDLYELPNAATANAVPTAVRIASSLGLVNKLMIDTNNRIWAPSGSGTLAAVTASGVTSSTTTLSGFSTTTFSIGGSTSAISATRSYGSTETGAPGGVYVANSSGSSISYLLSSGSLSGTSFTGGGIADPTDLAVDGAQNVWVANSNANGPSQFTGSGTALSPATGYSKTAIPATQRSIIIDASGNVWLGRNGVNTITEIVGAAVPVYQPYANGLPPATAVRFQRLP